MGNIRYQRTAHRITSALNCRPLKPSPRSICPAAPYPTGVHIPGIPPPAKFATEPIKGLEVAIALAVIIFESVFLQERCSRSRHLPPWRHVATRLLAAELLNDLDGLQEDRLFLFGRHCDRVLVGIAVRADFVTLVDDLPAFIRE